MWNILSNKIGGKFNAKSRLAKRTKNPLDEVTTSQRWDNLNISKDNNYNGLTNILSL